MSPVMYMHMHIYSSYKPYCKFIYLYIYIYIYIYSYIYILTRLLTSLALRLGRPDGGWPILAPKHLNAMWRGATAPQWGFWTWANWWPSIVNLRNTRSTKLLRPPTKMGRNNFPVEGSNLRRASSLAHLHMDV